MKLAEILDREEHWCTGENAKSETAIVHLPGQIRVGQRIIAVCLLGAIEVIAHDGRGAPGTIPEPTYSFFNLDGAIRTKECARRYQATMAEVIKDLHGDWYHDMHGPEGHDDDSDLVAAFNDTRATFADVQRVAAETDRRMMLAP